MYLDSAPEHVAEVLIKAGVKTHRLFLARFFVDVMFGIDSYVELQARILWDWIKAVEAGNRYKRKNIPVNKIGTGPRGSFPLVANAYGLLYGEDTFGKMRPLLPKKEKTKAIRRGQLVEWAHEDRMYLQSLCGRDCTEEQKKERRSLIKLVTRTYADRNVLRRLHQPGDLVKGELRKLILGMKDDNRRMD